MGNMPLLLSRKVTRFLVYLAIIFIALVLFKLLFSYEDFAEPEVPELVVQKGNDHYFKGNISVFTRAEISTWQKHTNLASSHEKHGKLNVHIWEEICGENLASLRNHVLFPTLPARRVYGETTAFSHVNNNKDFGERIFGFLHPKNSGVHSFRVRGSSFEVWMSTDFNPVNSKLLSEKDSSAGTSSVFEVLMKSGQDYYLEILHKKGQLSYTFDFQWKPPGKFHYSILSGNDISLMFTDKHLQRGEIDAYLPIKEIRHIHKKDKFPAYDSIEEHRANLYRLPLLDEGLVDNILPKCDYKPSYLVNHVLGSYHGVWETHYMSLYPIDKSNITRFGWVSLGNDELSNVMAMAVVTQFMEALNKGKREFKLKRVLSVEENHDSVKGDRYLLELELQKLKDGLVSETSFRLSKYVYKPKGSRSLCFPDGYRWRRNVTINIVLTVGGSQGKWVQHFINNIAKIYQETNDRNLNVVIMDFHSKDIDIKQSLEKSGLPRYMLLHMKSKFHKTMGLQYAMKFVTDPNDIVFVCDLHLYLPVTIIDHIRKHCIQGKTVFSPLLIRLDCGDTPNNPYGRWESDGYGPIATFKSDWDRFGGMNVEKFRNKWGGEDWEMVDRILSAGYEIERLKLLNFVHFYHTKKGMWHESEKVVKQRFT